MIKLYENGVYLINGKEIVEDLGNVVDIVKDASGKSVEKENAKKGTMAFSIMKSHNTSSDNEYMKIKYDSLTAHDIAYVGIIQTARASGVREFPIPFVLTNCHNSLCAVGGTINEDDHMFGLSAAKKYGGIYVPANLAVIHSYNREMMSRCGSMILGADSHTRYGALGTMGVGEGGGELVKQLLGETYDIKRPEVIGVYLTGKPQNGVGPQDIALTIVGSVYNNGFVKNKVMEFIGDGISNLDVEYRNGIDVMTTETACWSSIWQTDDKVRYYYENHGRSLDYVELNPKDVAYYDGLIYVDLSKIKPTIAMPFHPSNIYTIDELKENPEDIMHHVETLGKEQFDNPDLKFDLAGKIRGGRIHTDQGIIAGCAGGTFGNIMDVADIMEGQSVCNGAFTMSVYPGSQPTYMELVRNGCVEKLMGAGVIMRSAFCGPCLGAGDIPANQEFSVRHVTRNFPNREGSRPSEGQMSYVALMDARSIAATAINGGILTSATELDICYKKPKYNFDGGIYEKRVYNGFKGAKRKTQLHFGPNIKDWPDFSSLTEDLLLKVVSFISDPVTTTDELIPSGEISSFRSNPLRLAEYTLSRRDPTYVENAKKIKGFEMERQRGSNPEEIDELREVYEQIRTIYEFQSINPNKIGIGSTIFANKPGDGSAREQAVACQRVLGGRANIAREYAAKRYRSNLINWGMIPFVIEEEPPFVNGDYIFIPGIINAILEGKKGIPAYSLGKSTKKFFISTEYLTGEEKHIIISGGLINHNGRKSRKEF